MTRRSPLAIPRAARRIKVDAWDDIWPDALSLLWLPMEPSSWTSARLRISAFRAGETQIPRAREALIPKPNGLMRPAHQLAPDCRLYYQALVDTFMYDVDAKVAKKNHVFGYRTLAPRTTDAPFGFGLRQWKRFREQLRREVNSGAYGAMVRTDLAAFYERIPHGGLEGRLTSLGVKDEVARELRAFLKATMGKSQGLPQGPDPSGVLASAYLQPLDQALITAGYGYVRYVDDIVIFAKDQHQAKRALRQLEVEARRLDLIVQSAKTEIIVGRPAMEAEVNDDDDIAGIDYVIQNAGSRGAVREIRAAWRKASKARPLNRRLIKYILGRLTDNADDTAVAWVLKRLGELDYVAPTTARYLSRFANRKAVQRGVSAHLTSNANLSEWEETNLMKAMLSARKVDGPLIGRARTVAADKNGGIEVRQFAGLLLGRHGDPTDHEHVARECMATEELAQSGVVALQSADAKTRGRAYADIGAQYPNCRRLIARVRGRPREIWPVFK